MLTLFYKFNGVLRSSSKPKNLTLTTDTIIMKMAPLVRLYKQMSDSKYVIIMGVCTVT